jgi:acetylornithine deacetylase/succinyl-diaminopimelate desuccinylase-like protein
MTDQRTPAIQYAHENAPHFLEELKEFTSIPSISTLESSKPDVQRAASWLADHLRSLGIVNVQVFQTPGHPIVYGEWLDAEKNTPTALVYGHYDVQPVDPLSLWLSGPFAPEIRGDYIFARGCTDMKGQALVALNAIESIIKTAGRLPINFKFIFEGEEEIGSPNLSAFMAAHKDLLKCDVAINPDAGSLAPDLPAITYALRGLAYMELHVYGPDHDLHSGVFGGSILNPAQALCELIAGMHDAQGHITLPGFYDKIRPIHSAEKAELARFPLKDDYYLRASGAPALYGEAGYTTVERLGIRPTLEVNGIQSGFTGEGAKTVLPAWAMAKISSRLVPDQQPSDVYQQMRTYLGAHAPDCIRWDLVAMHGGPASVSDRESAYIQALSQALETVWHKPPVFKREGGSVPVVIDFQQILGVETVNTGFSALDDNMHSPNEKLHLPTWYRGIDAFIHFYFNLAQVNPRN